MKCPYCLETIADIDELNVHCLQRHPDKTTLENFKEDRRSRLWSTAVQLTEVVCNSSSYASRKKTVLDTFKYFLRELMQSE